MFTGIIEETGIVRSLEELDSAWRLKIQARLIINDIKIGDSISVNGCCLTLVKIEKDIISFDLLDESIKKTSIISASNGTLINLERALLPTTRMGGHFVSGHVDETGEITNIEKEGKDTLITIKSNNLKYIVPKGCITLDGISLTIYEVNELDFKVWLIPHTLEITNLNSKQKGDLINIEYDLIAKYIEKLKLN